MQKSFGDVLGHGHVEGSVDPEDKGHAAAEPEGSALASEGDIKTLKKAAKGLLWSQVRMCFVAAGVTVPDKARDCFINVGQSPSPPWRRN